MKVFITDEKHCTVNKEHLDLGEISEQEKALVEKVLEFLNRFESRYCQYRIGNTATPVYEDGEPIGIDVDGDHYPGLGYEKVK